MTVDKEVPMPSSALPSSANSRSSDDESSCGVSRVDSPRLLLAGLSVVQPTRAAEPYAMRWFRAWEGDLYRRAMRKTARSQWDLTRFSVDGGPEASRAGYRETQAAVSQAAKQAMAMAESNCGRPGPRERLALLYFDFWGQCSHLEQAFNWRDSFDLDVIPKFLLRDHGVNGYSCKIHAGRAAFVQGLNMAAELLDGGDIDSVLLGGVFRFYPALGFSEALVNAEQEQRWLGKGGRHTAAVIERVASFKPRPVTNGGLQFIEVATLTTIKGGEARNIVPSCVELNLNVRYAPGRSPESAQTEVQELVGELATVQFTDIAPPCKVPATNLIYSEFRTMFGLEEHPEQAYTDVAIFDLHGIPAINYGPGLASQRHQKGEFAPRSSVEQCLDTFQRFFL